MFAKVGSGCRVGWDNEIFHMYGQTSLPLHSFCPFLRLDFSAFTLKKHC